ncbi:uncharacterized protein EI97DRAFT_285788 [Westerdykella ornata]|uniref:Zn(2)-C6 fungal-type domain-containing protein n=1 Tax=Westerdykella ornata TaxID=318751 RepID=A0A6A6J472_WESOR|nr:uncharacterized protein EI97DRAFT_285788 [Westerdykella ornata]KAF2271371.1 hypothetical protein EI97DRAFT_285788 [Westerdykella ornata]
MVYTGKPSRGCAMCKSRRIKCDETKPVCMRCQKSNRVCPGFPPEFDLLHRDEGKAMVERAQRKRKACQAAKANGESVALPEDGSSSRAGTGNVYPTNTAQPGAGEVGMPPFSSDWEAFNNTGLQYSQLLQGAPPLLQTVDLDTGHVLEQYRQPLNHIVPQYSHPTSGGLHSVYGLSSTEASGIYTAATDLAVQPYYASLPTEPVFGQYNTVAEHESQHLQQETHEWDDQSQELEVKSFPGLGSQRFGDETQHLDFTVFQRLMSRLSEGIAPSLTLPPEYEAVVFFINDFIMKTLPLQPEAQRGFFQLLVPLYTRAKSGSALHMAFNAVALAVCGNYPDKQDLLIAAAQEYGAAMRKVNEAINDKELWKSDEIIVSVLLFSLYETIMSTNKTIDGWAHHVDGAVTLTIQRGTEQLKDPMSQMVFKAVRTMMITSCVQRSKPITPFPGELGWRVTDDSGETAANRLTLLSTDLPDIRAQAEALTAKPFTDTLLPEATALIDFAETIDGNLQEWYGTLPPGWRHRIIKTVQAMPEDVSEAEEWFGEIHAYQDVPVANLINDYRICRIFCQRVILACLTWQNPHGAGVMPQYVRAKWIVQQMVDEISACVPFHMSWDLQPVAQEKHQEKYAAEAFGGYSIMWPLYVAANAETVPALQRDWLLGRLDVIGTKYGLSTSALLAKARGQSIGPMFP